MSVTHPRGTSNTNDRGSAAQRRARRAWILETFDPDLGPDRARCALVGTHEGCYGIVDNDTMQVDRKVSGLDGGRYTRDNIQPSCPPCNHRKGILEREEKHRRECRGTCSRCRGNRALSMDYQALREAELLAREAATGAYETELSEYPPLTTFRDFLEQTASVRPDA